ncbi:MAG TPA: peptidoglycan DD-metalloendopeptidase family protein [Sulfuricaulis sp.]|nr:peptidoglycan DD-metalloendopeptidase family protein [Sulfuricaulis sp.]
MTHHLKYWHAGVLTIYLTACSAMPLTPVSEKSVDVRHPESGYREVLAGDTLYSIAWESGRDYREVARWNDISPPYLIKPGQKLRLFPPPYMRRDRQTAQISQPQPSRQSATAPTRQSGKDTYTVEKLEPPAITRPRSGSATKLTWSWPAEGKLLETFTLNGSNKGIDISGTRGQPVLAANAGKVVYQGGGLRGYGQLIIMQHDADFLSAYAHCDKIYIKEGDVIQRGQKIADMGSSGADKVMLHFEIRYRGVPVDPQDYLPRK